MDGYQRRTELKKERIKRTALELFTTYGVEKVSLAEIAQKANVSPVTIYNYFGTKDKLITKVITDMLEEALEQRFRLLRSDIPFREKIEKMIFDTKDFVQSVDPILLKEMMSNSPEMKAYVHEMYQRALPELLHFIEEGKRDGCINKAISNETIVLYFNILSEASGKIEVYTDNNKNQQVIQELTALVFYGLFNSPESSDRL